MKIAVLAPPERQALTPLLQRSGHEVLTPTPPTVAGLVALVRDAAPAVVVVSSGIPQAAYAPLAQVYAARCGIVALCYPSLDAGTLAVVVGALGGAVLHPRPNAEGRLTIRGADILAALDAVTSPRPAWLEAAQADPLFAAAVDAALAHGGMYSSRLLAAWLHVSLPTSRLLAHRIAALPGAQPPTHSAPGVLALPQAEAAGVGARALLRGVLSAAKLPIRKPRRRHKRQASGAQIPRGGFRGPAPTLDPPQTHP